MRKILYNNHMHVQLAPAAACACALWILFPYQHLFSGLLLPSLLFWHHSQLVCCRASQLPTVIGGSTATAPGSELLTGIGFVPTSDMVLPARSAFKALELDGSSALAIGGEQTCGVVVSIAADATGNVLNAPRAPHEALARDSVSISRAGLL